MKYLITGGCGFLGANLSSEVLTRNDELCVFDNLSRVGSAENLNWLKTQGEFDFVHGDIRNRNDIERVIKSFKPDMIFHLAGQVAMTTSISDPLKDFEINVIGTLNLLESLRNFSSTSILIYSSTNKVYGDLEQYTYTEQDARYKCNEYPEGFGENVSLDFRSPYGCSKGAADQYVLDYSRNYGLKTIVFRHSSIFGGRQYSTYDQGWIGWFIRQALLAKKNLLAEPFSISGNGKQVRDVLFASDLVNCYFSAADNVDNIKGQAFNIGGGMANSLSLLELFSVLEEKLDVSLKYTVLPWRSSDQKVFVADISKAKRFFGWVPSVNKVEGITEMISWVEESRG